MPKTMCQELGRFMKTRGMVQAPKKAEAIAAGKSQSISECGLQGRAE